MHLRQHDQHANSRQHAVHHRRRGNPEPAAQAQTPGQQLQQAGQQQDRPEHGHAMLAYQFEYQYRQASGRSTDLQRGTGEKTHDNTADNAGNQAFGGRHARSDRNAHAQRQGHQEDHHRRQQLTRQGRFQLCNVHRVSPFSVAQPFPWPWARLPLTSAQARAASGRAGRQSGNSRQPKAMPHPCRVQPAIKVPAGGWVA